MSQISSVLERLIAKDLNQFIAYTMPLSMDARQLRLQKKNGEVEYDFVDVSALVAYGNSLTDRSTLANHPIFKPRAEWIMVGDIPIPTMHDNLIVPAEVIKMIWGAFALTLADDRVVIFAGVVNPYHKEMSLNVESTNPLQAFSGLKIIEMVTTINLLNSNNILQNIAIPYIKGLDEYKLKVYDREDESRYSRTALFRGGNHIAL